jgi:eukaryotic-like serine/threonine-protein kinase
MTSTITGLPERYRPLDEVGPAVPTPTGVLRCWRAKDRILNRDVAIRVHTPGGPAARDWITRALTAGGLATPTLAMVYDASEGTGAAGSSAGPAGAAYVVNEWIEGETLAARIATGPMSDGEARTVLRRLADGVAEAHRVGLAVGGITPETVVLRPNGLVGLRSVPAPTGTIPGDIAALGELLEFCLTGRTGAVGDVGRVPGLSPDLAALVRRARTTEPGAGLSSVAAMAALLAERPRPHSSEPVRAADESDSGWLRRLRERHDADLAGAPRRGRPPVPPRQDEEAEDDLLPLGFEGDGADDYDDEYDEYDDPRDADGRWPEEADDGWDDDADGRSPGGTRYAEPGADEAAPRGRRRLLVAVLLALAVVVVVGLAWWLGSNVLSVAGSVDEPGGATSSPAESSAPAGEEPAEQPVAGDPAPIASAAVFNPFGDGDPENEDDAPLSYDGDPATSWSTVTYRGSAAFGNLKPGVGVLYDLGSEQELAAATVTTTTPGITVEVRTGDSPDAGLDAYAVAATGTVDGTAELAFAEPVSTRYVLVWVTSLAPAEGGFAGDLAEVSVALAG